MDREIPAFAHGVENLVSDELISQDAASDAKNWFSQDLKLQLIGGKLLIGADGIAGAVTGEIFGYKVDGTTVHYRKIGTKIQYLLAGTWTDIVTGLTSAADYAFTNYQSLAGSFTFAFGIDGIFKMHNAFPASYIALYDSSKNFKGHAFIDKGRTILWNRAEDKTGLYGSKIDKQDSTVYTTVTAENIGSGDGSTLSFSGTLAFKGSTVRNCFGVSVAVTGGETFTDNFLGVLTGSAGGTGTINYMTGAWTLTFTVAPANSANNIKATYQWENSTAGGVADFTKSSPRQAAEGFIFRQDEGGDPIQNVLIGPDGYYSMKKQSAYLLTLSADDTTATNNVYRKQMGLLSYRGAIASTAGIIFMNTANPEKPEMTILVKNLTGDAIEPKVLFPQFKFANYVYDDCTFGTVDRYIIVACRTPDAPFNDTILLCNVSAGTVDITAYNGRTFAADNGVLYVGSSLTQNIYSLYTGFDDDGLPIDNFWISKGENFGSKNSARMASALKKYRKMRLRGHIAPDQSYQVYISYDDAGFQLVGTVLGSASYVDGSTPIPIGTNAIGNVIIGGSPLTNVFPYTMEIRLKKVPKFRKRKFKFVALGIGYVDITYEMDHDISLFENKIPARFRQKQNVSLSGATTDNANPEF